MNSKSFLRAVITMIRDPFMLTMRINLYVVCGLLLSAFFGSDSGIYSGCAPDFNIGDGKNLMDKIKNVMADIIENCCGITFAIIMAWFGGIFPVLLIFPIELDVFLKVFFF